MFEEACGSVGAPAIRKRVLLHGAHGLRGNAAKRLLAREPRSVQNDQIQCNMTSANQLCSQCDAHVYIMCALVYTTQSTSS